MFLETLIMLFEFIRCQNIYRNFSGIFGSIYNILSTKYRFLGFSEFLKMVKSEFDPNFHLVRTPTIYIYICLAFPRRAGSESQNYFSIFNP
jgi:hypothetical protein